MNFLDASGDAQVAVAIQVAEIASAIVTFVVEGLAHDRQRLRGLLTHHGLVLARQDLKQGQEDRLVLVQLEALAQLLGDGEQDLVVLLGNQTCI